MASNDYSVHPSVVGRRVNIVAGPDEVVVCCAGREVARHGRCWAAHQTITDPAHRDAAAALRVAHRLVTAAPAIAAEVEQRPLTDYDRLCAIDTADEVA